MKVEEKKEAEGPAEVRCRVVRGMKWTGLEAMLAGNGQGLSYRELAAQPITDTVCWLCG